MQNPIFKKNIFLILLFSLATATLIFWVYNKYVLTKLNGETIQKVNTTSNTIVPITGMTNPQQIDFLNKQKSLK